MRTTQRGIKATRAIMQIFLLASAMFMPMMVCAQRTLSLREFYDATERERDLTAKIYPKTDMLGNVCALIKVQIDAENCTFECGNSIETQYKGNEYWVYVAADYLYKFYVSCPYYDKSLINIEEAVQRNALQQGHTYVLRLNGYEATSGRKETSTFLVLSVNPPKAAVFIDNKR